MSVGLRLKHRRRRAGMSQADLASVSGVGQDTISALENGKQEARPSTLRKLAASLRCEVGELVGPEVYPLTEATKAKLRTEAKPV